MPDIEIKGVTVKIHYPECDPKMQGDYYNVTIDVYDKKGYLTWHMDYGDHYHDKGIDKAQGFVDAIHTLFGDRVPVLWYSAADVEEY